MRQTPSPETPPARPPMVAEATAPATEPGLPTAVIEAVDLRKVYRLYAKAYQRFLDAFGLLRPGNYREHTALDGLTVTIARGEKVAIIGRNGAGKSTFLKLVTGVLTPTSGRLRVHGRIHALLQIGTGFHPDFTGRENVEAYLAQLGVVGEEASDKVVEVAEFAELEEYIDQPVKTYSTGMAARLMFATSTAIHPNILVLDEVLGVGDAYFAHKSYERIRELCEAEGTTVLLVTHDVYSALKIASRILWIDRGRILMDSDGPTVVKAYEDSIRVQEESRLRMKARQELQRAGGRAGRRYLVLEVQAADGRPQPAPVHFREIVVCAGERAIGSLPLLETTGADPSGSHLLREGTSWGEPATWGGEPTRPMLNYGSPFHRVSGAVALPPGVYDADMPDLTIRLTYASDEPANLAVRAALGSRECDLGLLPSGRGAWVTHSVVWPTASGAPVALRAPVNATGVLGAGDVRIFGLHMLDETGDETHFVAHGAPATFVAPFEIVRPDLDECADVVVSFHREGTLTACRIHTRTLRFHSARRRAGTVRLHVPRMVLGKGTYALSIMVARQGYYDSEPSQFFTVNPDVYFCLNRVLEIEVTGGGLIAEGTAFVGEGEWSITDGDSSASTPGTRS